MTADDLLKALYSVGIAALGIVSIVLGVVARYTPEIISTILERSKLISLDRAGAIAARASEEHGRSEGWGGPAKQSAAQALVKSIAPVATARIDSRELADVVKAGVQQMRASIPTPEGLTPIPVTVVSSVPPSADAIPPPARVPTEP